MSDYTNNAIEATIAELKPGMKSVNITFKVMNMSDERSVESRNTNETYRVVDAMVGDSTGTILLPLWNEAIDSVKEGETYTLTNGYTGLFKANLRLQMGKFGSLASAAEKIEEVNTTLDMSAKDYNNKTRSS